MCGRTTCHLEREALGLYDLVGTADPIDWESWRPTWNLAVTQPIPVLAMRDGERVLRPLRWGLIPSWAKDASIGANCSNARSETVHEKPAFRDAFKKRRCLVLVTGWYEWQHTGGKKIPHWFHPTDGSLVALAGLWEAWRDPATESVVRSTTIITTEPNATAGALHDRMPVVLSGASREAWLDPKATADDLRALLKPCAEDLIAVHEVGAAVGSVRAHGPELILPREGAPRARAA